MKDKKYEIRVGKPSSKFLCNKYTGFGNMYVEWGGGWCLEVFLAHKRGMGDSTTPEWAEEIRRKFDKHFSENNVDGSLYFSVGDWDELVENVLTKGG